MFRDELLEGDEEGALDGDAAADLGEASRLLVADISIQGFV
jgi:hypothetical protein